MNSKTSTKNILDIVPPSYTQVMSSASSGGKGPQRHVFLGILIGLGLLLLLALLVYWLWPSSGPSAASTSTSTSNVAGTWASYNAQGTATNYSYQISQTGSNLTINDTNMPAFTSTAVINGTTITAPTMKLTGTVSTDGSKITWSDQSYWQKTS